MLSLQGERIFVETPSCFLEKLECALRELVRQEGELIRREPNEVCINHRFAIYLENVFRADPNYYWVSVDLEYDKNYKDKKAIQTAGGKQNIRPDILIHKREDNYNNLIAIECKKGCMKPNDRLKLTALLDKPYEYSLSCSISYLPQRNYMLVIVFQKDAKEIKCRFDKESLCFECKRT